MNHKKTQTKNEKHSIKKIKVWEGSCIIPKCQCQRKHYRFKESKEIPQLNEIPACRLDSVLEGKSAMKCYKQSWSTNGRLKYCIHAKYAELIAVLWLCTRIPLCLRKFTVKYLEIKGYDVRN